MWQAYPCWLLVIEHKEIILSVDNPGHLFSLR
jgi:hypothetical protein